MAFGRKPTTLIAALEQAAGHGEGHGLRLLDRKGHPTWLSWPEIHRRARRAAAGLQRLGVQPGERVALIYPTGAGFFEAFFGALMAGAVPTPLYPPVRLGRAAEYQHRTARMLTLASARVVLADARVRRVIGEAIAEARPPLGCLTLDKLPEGELASVGVRAEGLGLVQFSSGTTGDPRPVALSHQALLAQTDALISLLTRQSEHPHAGVSWLPLYHDMGLIGCVFPALRYPGTLTLLGPEVFVTRPITWLKAISDWQATISPAPNFAYALCVDRITDEQMEGLDLSSWHFALNGAEPVAPEVLRRFSDRFAQWGLRRTALTPVYGLSEAALAVTFSASETPFESARFNREALACGTARPEAASTDAESNEPGTEIVSVGQPLPGFTLEIRDDASQALPERQVGRVCVRGPSLMVGYLDQPKATGEMLQGGWLDTGDLGFLDAGQLYLTGRAKDVLILRGRNHAPHPVEQAVDAVEGVRTGCAAAVSHRPGGAPHERLLLFVEARADIDEATRSALPGRCLRAIQQATGLVCDEIHLLTPGTLPRTSSGKIRRQAALRQHLAGELTPPDPVNPLRVVGLMTRSALGHARSRRGG